MEGSRPASSAEDVAGEIKPIPTAMSDAVMLLMRARDERNVPPAECVDQPSIGEVSVL
jgi:hypothetical protein